MMNAKRATILALVLSVSLGCWTIIGQSGRREPSSAAASAADGGTAAPAPEFTGVTEWINSKPLKLADQKGKVVVVHFWTNGCINCIHNYPHYRAWQGKYKDTKSFLIIGVHTPELDAEKDVRRIKNRMARNKLTFPVAVDNSGANWKAWENQYWPCIYLVDKTGAVRYRWEGELGEDGYKRVTGNIDKLLTEQ